MIYSNLKKKLKRFKLEILNIEDIFEQVEDKKLDELTNTIISEGLNPSMGKIEKLKAFLMNVSGNYKRSFSDSYSKK